MDKEILIKKYLHAELNEKEYQSLLHIITTNPDFAEELQVRTVFYAQQSSNLKIYFRKLLAKRLPATPSTKSTSNALGSLAKKLLQSLLGRKHAPPVVLRSDSSIGNQWKIAIQAYQEERYPIVIHSIQNIWKTNKEQKVQQLYLGLSYMYTDPPQYTTALEQFDKILTSSNPMRKDEAKWYAGLAYLKTGQQEKATQYLTQIVSEKAWKSSEAKQLLEVI